MTVCEFDAVSNTFVKLHTEVFGKTGCRRAVPGQYVACDPKGRAIMVRPPRALRFCTL
jgi:splicing factor 3B subunit 3